MFKDKRGELVLRNIILMLVIFSTVMLFSTWFVLDMATTYDNTEMIADYQGSQLNSTGMDLYLEMNESIGGMKEATSGGLIGTFQLLSSALNGMGTILKLVFFAPVYFADAIGAILSSLEVIPSFMVTLIQSAIILGLYIMIIFIIASARLQGGKV